MDYLDWCGNLLSGRSFANRGERSELFVCRASVGWGWVSPMGDNGMESNANTRVVWASWL
jgi:hypothetical protein